MGDRSAIIERVRGYVTRYLPDAGSLLELGCGTGAVLAGLADGLQVTGIDLSPEMLAAAKASLTGVRLVQADITKFSLGTTFDVVICVFDTLNHLPSFGAWLAMFGHVDAHLAAGGLFIFDVNTVGRLRRLAAAPAYVEDFGPHTLIMDVTSRRGRRLPLGCAHLRTGRGQSVPAAPRADRRTRRAARQDP